MNNFENQEIEEQLQVWDNILFFKNLTNRMAKKYKIYPHNKQQLIQLIKTTFENGYKPQKTNKENNIFPTLKLKTLWLNIWLV